MFCWEGGRYEVRSLDDGLPPITIDTPNAIYEAYDGIASDSLDELILYGLR